MRAGPRRIYTALLLGLSAALVLVVYAYLQVRQPAEVTTTTVAVDAGPVGLPVFSYSVEASAGRAFRPRGAVLSGDTVFVADSEGSRVAVLDLTRGSGAQLGFIPISPDRPEEALPRAPQPTGVVVLPDGSLLVADPGNGRIWTLSPDGALLGEFPSDPERIRSRLGRPVGLALFDTQVYVTDVQDQTVKVYTTSGRFLRAFGDEGFLPGRFSFPNALTVGSDGRTLYIADSNNRRVQITDTMGVPQAIISAAATDEGLSLPRGVALDRFGRLHVVDTFEQTVFVYDSSNTLMYSYGGAGTRERLDLPEGIAIGEDTIVVSDGGNRRLVVFRY